jgi:TATA-box binding protein (TBP) (component of TFIID and TFIIIB)
MANSSIDYPLMYIPALPSARNYDIAKGDDPYIERSDTRMQPTEKRVLVDRILKLDNTECKPTFSGISHVVYYKKKDKSCQFSQDDNNKAPAINAATINVFTTGKYSITGGQTIGRVSKIQKYFLAELKRTYHGTAYRKYHKLTNGDKGIEDKCKHQETVLGPLLIKNICSSFHLFFLIELESLLATYGDYVKTYAIYPGWVMNMRFATMLTMENEGNVLTAVIFSSGCVNIINARSYEVVIKAVRYVTVLLLKHRKTNRKWQIYSCYLKNIDEEDREEIMNITEPVECEGDNKKRPSKLKSRRHQLYTKRNETARSVRPTIAKRRRMKTN